MLNRDIVQNLARHVGSAPLRDPTASTALAFFRSRGEQTIVELALRQQLAAYAQARPRPRLTSLDRAFWVALHRLWPRWREVLVIVKPETVVRWHRKGFCFYWRALPQRGPGRP